MKITIKSGLIWYEFNEKDYSFQKEYAILKATLIDDIFERFYDDVESQIEHYYYDNYNSKVISNENPYLNRTCCITLPSMLELSEDNIRVLKYMLYKVSSKISAYVILEDSFQDSLIDQFNIRIFDSDLFYLSKLNLKLKEIDII